MPRKIAKHPKEGRDQTLDGLGNKIDPAAMYYVQDARPGATVGNCVSWWGPNGSGYRCDIDEAGQYTGAHAMGLRASDVAWPVALVRAKARLYVDHQKLDAAANAVRDAADNARDGTAVRDDG